MELRSEYIDNLKSIQNKADFLEFNSIDEFRNSIENN